MRVYVAWLAALALSLPAPSDCDPLFVLTAPNLLRVGSKENVFVEAQEYTGQSITVDIVVKDFPAKKREILSKKVTLNAGNKFQALQEIMLSGDFFEEETHMKQYVYLQAKFPQRELEKVILVSFQSGVFAMNSGLEPVKTGVSVEIMTPDGITVEKELLNPEKGIISGLYQLPELVRVGTWKVVCRFQNTPQRNFTADFEVKEYVLPSFEVKLTPEKPFFYVDEKELSVKITARYLYGKDVSGKAFVVFGVLTEDGEKKSIPASLQRVNVVSGNGVAKITSEQIQKTFPDINQLINLSLYVSVSVLTGSGSEMVEAERRGILIVTSPYTIHFKHTPTYFKPGMPFQVAVYVTNPDDTPADGIDVVVTPGEVLGRTQENGVAKLTINTQGGVANLPITVKTKAPALTEARQAKAHMKALPYTTNSNNYLHISIQAAELKIGDNLQINLNPGNSPGFQAQDKHITYLVINKGQLVRAERYERMKGQSLVTLSLPVTKDMIPSFRFVAYYHVGTEVVSDSVWVDVKDTCMGKLEVTSTKERNDYEPRKSFSLTITGDPEAKVGLVAVDKGVYVLNSKNRLTQTKIWDIIEKHDIGCTPGSGANSMGVFYDAGLAFQSSAGGTPSRSEPNCPVRPKSRRRRSLTLIDLKSSLAGNYTGLEKQCCRDGMLDNLLEFTCERRSHYIVDSQECIKAFLHCCTVVEKKTQEAKSEDLLLARSEEDDYYLSDSNIVSRTQFPESWLWEEMTLPGCPAGAQGCKSTSTIKNSFLKDSITTWEITAISLSKTHGICVADPFEIKVMKSFFIDLKLPYAAVRNEQLEIKAVLHNYNDEEIKVRVELMETEQVCSAASKKRKYRMPEVFMDPMSSRAVPFVIIPMALGMHSIEVKASVYDSSQSDGVKKDLLVVAEGLETKKEVKTVVLNPSVHDKGVQTEKILHKRPPSQVPGSPAHTYISVTGELLSQTIQGAISGKPMGSLINQPTGCGEQNMIGITGPVIATHYLDKTGQWEQIGLDRRAEAIKFIRMGYTQQLAYRTKEGAFSVWVNGNPSSWLTAYVAKVFGLAYNLISIEEDVLCNALKWLVLNTQQPDGIFKEVGQVIHGEMVGHVRGKDSDASMTAFVLIAMQDARHICIEKVNSLPDSMKNAIEFLSGRIQSLTNPYAVALTAYALSNEGNHQLDILNRFSSGKTHWPVPGSNLFTLEATGYALMALVNAKEFDQAGNVVKWLTEQRFYGGGYGSTQATIVVFQAVAMYMTKVSDVKDVNLQVNLDVAGRAKPIKWTYNKNNAHLTRSEKTRIDQDLTVTATGTGQGTMSVMTIYNALPEAKKRDCNKFELNVTLDNEPKDRDESVLDTYKLTIDMLYLSDRDATMSVLDITMLTGFIAEAKDLQRLTTGRDKYVQKIEMDKQLSEKGSLILYLDKVSHQLPDRVVFRINKMNRVGLLQPAAVTLYEYYSMENRCMKFYHPQKKDGALNRICLKDVCRCAEENCSYQRRQENEDLDRGSTACSAGMDYVYKVKVVRADLTNALDYFTVLVEDVVKEGTDSGVKGKERTFMAHPYCREAIDLQEGKTYLIMGKSEDLIHGEDGLMYMLGGGTWIEYWPTEGECQQPDFRDACLGIKEATADLLTFGCPT